ncbi:hypothetical protein [Carnobacterium maltaromaticum]|uniref:hypothetical protein n=1 Tax=Carnobacterium maltaromaticum TaxID=2751 RepID=UPI001F3A719B|nr:hypothetical protein [Carnobacterium maltaromaticum]
MTEKTKTIKAVEAKNAIPEEEKHHLKNSVNKKPLQLKVLNTSFSFQVFARHTNS